MMKLRNNQCNSIFVFGVLAAIVCVGVLYFFPQNQGVDILQTNTPTTLVPRFLSEEQIATYHKDGVVLVRELLNEEDVQQLQVATEYEMNRRTIYGLVPNPWYHNLAFDVWRKSSVYANLAVRSLPKIAAQILIHSNSNNNKIRLLRDAIFQNAPDKSGCGWHVDDRFFWPTARDTGGPTIWIALDDMQASEGGGIGILNRTKFAQEFGGDEEVCRTAIMGATCDMEDISPNDCHAKMERSKLTYDMKAGDALIWDRWTFHKGLPTTTTTTSNNNSDNQEQQQKPEGKRRYSVRYVPNDATASGVVHSSVEQGKALESPYYPQVWPTVIDSEIQSIERGLEEDVSLSGVVTFIKKKVIQKFKDFLESSK